MKNIKFMGTIRVIFTCIALITHSQGICRTRNIPYVDIVDVDIKFAIDYEIIPLLDYVKGAALYDIVLNILDDGNILIADVTFWDLEDSQTYLKYSYNGASYICNDYPFITVNNYCSNRYFKLSTKPPFLLILPDDLLFIIINDNYVSLKLKKNEGKFSVISITDLMKNRFNDIKLQGNFKKMNPPIAIPKIKLETYKYAPNITIHVPKIH